MDEPGHVLISLEETHAKNILAGTKKVELRTRAMAIPAGTVVWIYVKKPLGAIVGSALVIDGHSFAPSTLWRKFSDVSGLTWTEFFSYFDGVKTGFALELGKVSRLSAPITLESLRGRWSAFHPPQFFMRLSPDSEVLKMLQKASKSVQPRLGKKG